jgi:hypothetical protein
VKGLRLGTVPGYGMLGRALVAYARETEILQTFERVMPEQSIISLLNAGDIILGGTSVFGNWA